MAIEHDAISIGEVHIIHNWAYADAAARTSAAGLTSGDLHKVALQTDNDTLWVLVATTPTWIEIATRSEGAGALLLE